jgi:D-glycero-D-manno-heptose 1,7-bisphosphate phosphatase
VPASLRPAIFLDRDGTLVHPRHYPSTPEELVLYDGIAPALRRLQAAGFTLVVVTNQSGLARGYFTAAQLSRMHRHLHASLAALGVSLAAIYHCPHHPDGVVPHLAVPCACRKPQPGMLLAAAHDHAIDLRRSWLVGDILDDVEAGNRAGCRTVLVDLGTEAPPGNALRRPDVVAAGTVQALDIILSRTGLAAPQTPYLPVGWRPDDLRRPALRGIA